MRRAVELKAVETQFRFRKFRHTQEKRDGSIALFRQEDTESDAPPAWEVVKIKHHDGYEAFGSYIEPAEYYPKDERWGEDGFTFRDRDQAVKKYNRLIAAQKRRTT